MMEKIRWVDRVKNGVLQKAKKARKILHTIKRMKANWICRILRKDCLLKHLVEGKTEEKGSRGGRRKQLLDDLQEIK
jgi:hypothetical protein